MDMDAVRAGMNGAVPFAGFVGVDIEELEPGACLVRLPDRDELRNHVGSQHAGALFTAGEAASGGAFVGAFAEQMAELRPLVRDASIRYTKVARGPIAARARFDQDVEEVRATLESDGVVDFNVAVELTDDDGQAVAEMTVVWNVKKTS